MISEHYNKKRKKIKMGFMKRRDKLKAKLKGITNNINVPHMDVATAYGNEKVKKVGKRMHSKFTNLPKFL